MKYSAVVGTDIGMKKLVNQDSFLIKTAHTNLGNVCMGLICDGVGGLDDGEKASQMVVGIFEQWFTNEFRNTADKVLNLDKLDKEVLLVLNQANSSLVEYGNRRNKRLGTTASLIIFVEENYFTYHIGDTRIYRYSNKLFQLTQDHTLVAAKLKNGQITQKEAQNSSEKNILLQCIGVNDKMEIHKSVGSCSKNEVFLLCCDGLYNKLLDSEIEEVLKNQKNLEDGLTQESVDYFIDTVKNRGEKDNISGLIIKLV